MKSIIDPAAYESWYHTPRGQWVADQEFSLMQHLLMAGEGTTLLDIGCGTGYFSCRFARRGLSVTGIDPDPAMLKFARTKGEDVRYLQGSALELPFPDYAFDYTVAVTSFCFIDAPMQALQEMWRVSRYGLVLGLLNRYSLLHMKKQGRGSYLGARWDTASEVLNEWLPALSPTPGDIVVRSAVFLPQGTRIAQWLEQCLPGTLTWGGFLAIGLKR